MSGTGSPDEPTYLASEPEVSDPRRPGLAVGAVAVVIALVAGITAVVVMSRDGGDDTGKVATATTEQRDDGPDDATVDSALDDAGDTVAPDSDDEPIAALIPGDTLLDEWEIRNAREEPTPDLAGDLIVAPAGSTVDTEQAVWVTVYPDKYLDPRSDEVVEVSLGELQGFYSAHDDGLASLVLGDGEQALELSAAPGTTLETLTALAERVDIGAPIDTLDPGPDWQVVASSAEIRPEMARRVRLGAIEGRAELTVLIYEGVDESALALLAPPFVTRPVEVRGREALASTALESRQGASMSWMERPDVLVAVWILGYPEGHDADEALFAITEQLVAVDADGWSEFVKAQQPLPIPDDPENYTPAEGEILGELADGRTYLLADVPGEGICLLIDWEERGCEQRVGEDRLVPAEIRSDEDSRTLLIYGYVADGANTVAVEWNDAITQASGDSSAIEEDPARTAGGIWAVVAAPTSAYAQYVYHYDGSGPDAELVAIAMPAGASWATRYWDP